MLPDTSHALRGSFTFRGKPYTVILDTAGDTRGLVHVIYVVAPHQLEAVLSGATFVFESFTLNLGDAQLYDGWDQAMFPHVVGVVMMLAELLQPY